MIGSLIPGRLIPVAVCLFVFSVMNIAAQPTNNEVYTSAVAKGGSVADYWVYNAGKSATSKYYADGCSFYGACMFGTATSDTSYRQTIYTNYKRSMPTRIPTGNVDSNAAGILPLHLFLLTKDSSLLTLAKPAADASVSSGGYKRYAIDDTYMTGSLMMQAYRATGNAGYLDFCADYIVEYMNRLLQSNGLYWHRDGSHIYWGRGNGWGAASTTELLLSLPTSHARYAAVLDGYRRHMNGLLAVQKASGMWMQVLTSTDPRNWEESSGTGMFLFAMFTGIKYGWLDSATFLGPAKRGWQALAAYVGTDGRLGNICVGFWGDGTEASYLNAGREAGNAHGTCAFLWAASAAINLLGPSTAVNEHGGIANRQFVRSPSVVEAPWCAYDLLGRPVFSSANAGYLSNPRAAGIVIQRRGTTATSYPAVRSRRAP